MLFLHISLLTITHNDKVILLKKGKKLKIVFKP